MDVIEKIFIRFLCAIAIFYIFTISAFAKPGIKITSPINGSIVNPGQSIVVTIEAVDGFVVKEGTFISFKTEDHEEEFTSLPASFTITVLKDAAGKVPVGVMGIDVLGNEAAEMIELKVQQTAALQSIESYEDEILINLDWDGKIKGKNSDCIATVYGTYSDGIKREIPREELSYISSDPSIISIDSKGNYQIHKAEQAAITVSFSGKSKFIPLVFLKPRGIRPSETIPPTAKAEIRPTANAAGWHNQDINITLTAQDNEGGSGVREIDYSILGTEDMQNKYVESNETEIFFDKEGSYELVYSAIDKEGNYGQTDRHNLKLDKTPPVTNLTITPQAKPSGWIVSLPVEAKFTAVDNLSGLAFTTPNRIITKDGVQEIEYFSKDIADNLEKKKLITLKVDSAPPDIKLNLTPVSLKPPKDRKKEFPLPHFYKFSYSFSDATSGIKDSKSGLAIPSITGFKPKLVNSKESMVSINLKRKTITIYAPNPKSVLDQLKTGIFPIANNQIMHLNFGPSRNKLRIIQIDNFIAVKAPSIGFKAEASDNAGNTVTKELPYTKINKEKVTDEEGED